MPGVRLLEEDAETRGRAGARGTLCWGLPELSRAIHTWAEQQKAATSAPTGRVTSAFVGRRIKSSVRKKGLRREENPWKRRQGLGEEEKKLV